MSSSGFQLVDPRGWEVDLHSVYSAYVGYFQLHSVPWYDRSWGYFFESFEEFLSFSWPVVTVTDARTGRAHIVTRPTSVGAFLRMIKTRFGETLPPADNALRVAPFETQQRPLRTVSDGAAYRKLHAALPAVALAAQRARVRGGEPAAIRALWGARGKSWLAVAFKVSERGTNVCFEWGYAALRCAHLDALGVWPPNPDTNYRRGHYIVSEYADRTRDPSSWQYAFGETQMVPRAKSSTILQSVISSLASPSVETFANDLIIVCHGLADALQNLEEMKIKLPSNAFTIDTAAFEAALFSAGQRGPMQDVQSGQPRAPGSRLSLPGVLYSLAADAAPCALQNPGNAALLCLFALQKLLDPAGTRAPDGRGARPPAGAPRRSPAVRPAAPQRSVSSPGVHTPPGGPFRGYGGAGPGPAWGPARAEAAEVERRGDAGARCVVAETERAGADC